MGNRQLSLFDKYGFPIFSALSELFADHESDELEYKAAQGGFPTDFWKTYSAFANTNGGIIILGVKERKSVFQIEGLQEDKITAYKKLFWDGANNPVTVSVNLMTEADVKHFSVEGKLLMAFKVPAATRTQRPVFLTRNPFENTYKRNHEGDYKCTNEEVRRMLADADLNHHPDSRVLQGFSMDDLDEQSVRQYRQLFAVARPGHAWLVLEDKELLIQLGAYRKDRKSKLEGPTVAGVLMFGKGISITDPECCPNFFPDFRELLSTDPQIRWTDRIYPDGSWEANLFQFYRRVWPRLSSSLPKPFQLKKGVRQDETPAHTALREAFVNALIHTDYSAPGNIIIEQRSDTFRFSNPGTLLVSIQQYYHGGISECRNTSIQKMFLMIGSAEKAGSGVNKIMAGWEYAHWRTPYLSVESQPDRLSLELPMFSILPEETLQELRHLFGDQVDSLGKDELTILAACHIEGEITNSRLQFMIARHRTDITRILQELCKSGYLQSDNKNRWTTYHLNADYKRDILHPNMDTSAENMDSSGENVDTTGENMDSSGKSMDTSTENMDTSVGTMDTSKRKKWLSKPELEKLIIGAVHDQPKSLEEIAGIVGKTAKYLKNTIVPEMIKEQKLEMLYPDSPNHPYQKYKAK